MLKAIKRKISEINSQIIRLFIIPFVVQVIVVHITIGIFVAKSLIGRSLLVTESALIAAAFVICQIVQLKTIQVHKRVTKKKVMRLIKSEVVR